MNHFQMPNVSGFAVEIYSSVKRYRYIKNNLLLSEFKIHAMRRLEFLSLYIFENVTLTLLYNL